MARIAILSCKKIQDVTCVGCMKCFKAIKLRDGEFRRYKDEEIDVACLADCGDCPGLMVPKVGLILDMAKVLERPIDVIYFGSCIVGATQTAECPIDIDEMKVRLEGKYGVPVVVGTHPW